MSKSHLLQLLSLGALLLLGTGCERDDTEGPAPQPNDNEVYLDEFGPDVTFMAFANSKLDALEIEYNDTQHGSRALKFTVPSEGDPSGWFAGGTFVTQNAGRDLSSYNALSLWVKASVPATIGVVGFGNDNTGTSRFTTEWAQVEVGTAWQKLVIPIPLPEKLTDEKGLFHFAAGAMNGAGYTLWFDEVQFEDLEGIANPRPHMASDTLQVAAGSLLSPSGMSVTFAVDGVDRTLDCLPGWFTFSSTDSTVVLPTEDGQLDIVGGGSATVTAQLGTVEADGSLLLQSMALPAGPAPTPQQAAAEVFSLFSNAYSNATVDSWSAQWDMADVADLQVAGDDVKLYTNVSYAGIEFTTNPVDVHTMTHLHLDVHSVATGPFKVKLVDFGADGVYGGGDDQEGEVTLSATSTPPMLQGQWSSLDIPLSRFGQLGYTHVAQMILSGSHGAFFLDNVYFFQGEAAAQPTTPAPTPTFAAADVISLFSDSYSNQTVDTWSASWDVANVGDVLVGGNATKQYTSLSFAGIEFTSQTIDASAMTHFHLNLWTADPTASPAQFKVKLVDFGANGAYGGGDDVEHEVAITASTTPALQGGTWLSLDLPFTQFTNLVTRQHLAQLILSGDLETVWIDNVLFHR
jgi:hypothetical protein